MNNKSKKVLNIITLFSVGGATETVVSMAEGLIKKGYDVHIATGPNIPTEGSMYETTERLKIPVHTFKHMKRDITLLSDLIIIFQLAKFIKKNEYDIVHTHSSKAGVVGRLAAWIAGTPIRIHTIHGLPFHRYQNWLLRNFFKLIEKFVALFTNKIVSVTHTIVDVMTKNNLAPPSKFVVIRSGFNFDRYINYEYDTKAIREKYGLTEENVVIGMVSRISILKGHDYLVKAFEIVSKKVPNAKLLLVGNGEYEVELRKIISDLKLESKIVFTGLIPPDDIPSAISAIDILAHTSLHEGLARVFPQSIIMGKPVVSFDLDGAHEAIKDGHTGYLVEPENIEMLSDKLIDLASDLEKAKRFGEAGKDFLKDEFSDTKMVDQIYSLYEKLLSKI